MLATEEKKLHWLGIDMHSRLHRRIAVGITYAGFAALICVFASWQVHPLWAMVLMALTAGLLRAASVFRNNGLVKSFENSSNAAFGSRVVVGSLDEWARYRFGVADFAEATQEQQAELLSQYRVGNYLVPAKPLLDERERVERDSACRWALDRIAFWLACYAGVVVMWKGVQPLEFSAVLWGFALVASTLPQARVLWTEPDPHDLDELRLAKSEA
jgi:hypothetical protein